MASRFEVSTITPIRKMDRAIAFYTKKLGGKLTYRAEGDMKNDFASIRLAGHELWLIDPPEREKRSLAYTVISVKNLKRFVTQLRGKGVKFEKAVRFSPESRLDGPITYDPVGASAFFRDSEGNLLMAWQQTMGM